ncbi:MAG: tryptophan 2,3-dioxygenase [Thermonema sp.]|uniref:tryptophan 2,3-dioxygenase family protein n=1 Tax=Thermonema sp. TaxID=2231181 RepID=UPI0021DBD958|nr:tryptophan 2,3-dioxygenase family protein [Thermonema sp.]GIV38597.1 MAG: tryptophan 2,3-dioxygenase [Thermonema sp.]
MTYQDLDEKVMEQLRQLQQRYAQTGQDLASNLEGLLYTDYLKYWDYIALDTLMTLQRPRTTFPDEMIFVVYHQITELFFKLIQWEIDQLLGATASLPFATWHDKMQRINRYMDILVRSSDIMSDGMEFEQFRKFRMALLPASGFQSVQFREIELKATSLWVLLDRNERQGRASTEPVETLYPLIYWKRGAIETESGKKTITLQHFEEKYDAHLMQLARRHAGNNLYTLFKEKGQHLTGEERQALREEYRRFDNRFNVGWRLAHLRAAAKYLMKKKGEAVAATGGTNWTKYLPPRFQKIIFFPSLWTEEEVAKWGTQLID